MDEIATFSICTQKELKKVHVTKYMFFLLFSDETDMKK